jgi:hypothetical protein
MQKAKKFRKMLYNNFLFYAQNLNNFEWLDNFVSLSQVSGQKAHKGRKKDFLEERDGNL